MKKKVEVPKRRNEHAYALMMNRAGIGKHIKTNKAKRRKEKIDFLREVQYK